MRKNIKYIIGLLAILILLGCTQALGKYLHESEGSREQAKEQGELGETIVYFNMVDNTWYKEYILFTDDNGVVLSEDTALVQAVTSELTETSLSIINYDESQIYLMKILIKDDGTDINIGIPDHVVVNNIYMENFDSDNSVTLENGETISSVLHLDLSKDFVFNEDGTPLDEVQVAHNIETIVNTFTLCGRYDIDAVDFYFDGEKLDSIGGVMVDGYITPSISADGLDKKE